MTNLSDAEIIQYSRQILIKDIAKNGQKKLKSARVFVAGAGGLGSSALYYLTVAGIGEIFVCDFDVVELTNLNRQIVHDQQSIGMLKVDSARDTLSAINPHVKIHTINAALTEQTTATIIPEVDIILDCLDNYEARSALNVYAINNSIPLVYASVSGFAGHLSFLNPPDTPCFYCLYQGYTVMGEIPVFGVTTGVIGSLQALEVIKFVTGVGDLIKNKLLTFDGRTGTIRHVSITYLKQCPYCSNVRG